MRMHEKAETLVENFQSLFHTLNRNTCQRSLLELVYDDNMIFEDSFHHVEGLEEFTAYCVSLYENVTSISFDFHDTLFDGDSAMLTWTMSYRHPRISKGEIVKVAGASHIRFKDKVTYHRDYFDGGQLLYEHVPLLGSVIQQIKKRMK